MSGPECSCKPFLLCKCVFRECFFILKIKNTPFYLVILQIAFRGITDDFETEQDIFHIGAVAGGCLGVAVRFDSACNAIGWAGRFSVSGQYCRATR